MFKKKIAQAIEPAAEAKRPDKEGTSKQKRKKLTFRDAMARAGKWFRELKSEFKKVGWSTKKQSLKDTAVVLVVLIVVGVVVGLLDYAFEKLILEQILKLATGY